MQDKKKLQKCIDQSSSTKELSRTVCITIGVAGIPFFGGGDGRMGIVEVAMDQRLI